MRSIVGQKAQDFAVEIYFLNRKLIDEDKEYVLSKQVLRSGTSISANIAEAEGGFSRADFIAKISIAYKESLETKNWLEILKRVALVTEEKFNFLFDKCEELAKMLYSTIQTSRNNQISENRDQKSDKKEDRD